MKTQLREKSTASVVKIGASRQVAIPKKLHDQLRLAPGDYLEVGLHNNRLILTPKTLIDRRLERGLARGVEDIAKGRTYGPFYSAKALVRSLHREARRLKKR